MIHLLASLGMFLIGYSLVSKLDVKWSRRRDDE